MGALFVKPEYFATSGWLNNEVARVPIIKR